MRSPFSYSGDNEWSLGVPWWWRSARFVQSFMNLGEGVLNFMIMAMVAWSWPILVIASFSESVWWAIPAVIVGVPFLFFCYAEALAGLRYHQDKDKPRYKGQSLLINEYRALPRKYTRKLRRTAKLVDHPDCSNAIRDDWKILIKDLYDLHGEDFHYEAKRNPTDKRAIDAMNHLKEYTKEQKELAQIAKQIEEEIRANFEQQNISLEGIDKLYG